MAQHKKKRCPKCGYGRKKWGKKFGLVCDSCERMLIDQATRNYYHGAIPPLTNKEKEIYSKP